MKNIDQEQFIKLSEKDDHIIIDVRRPDECASGIISGAVMIDIMNRELFMQELMKLDKSKSYLVYCRSGNRSGKACQIMEGLGFVDTYNLVGGILALKNPVHWYR